MEKKTMNGGKIMWRPIAAIAGIVIIDVALIFNGIDGTVALISVAAVAGLGGYPVTQWLIQTAQKFKQQP